MPAKRPVLVDGCRYPSIKAAAIEIGVSGTAVKLAPRPRGARPRPRRGLGAPSRATRCPHAEGLHVPSGRLPRDEGLVIRARAVALILGLAPVMAGSTVRSVALPLVAPPVSPSRPAWTAPGEYAALVESAARVAGVPPRILGRLLERESSWRSGAVGVNRDGTRDLGIAQLGERWLSDFAWFDNGGEPFDPFSPAEAIPVAARYLARLHRATGDWRAAVAAYNCGLSRVRAGRIPERTLDYIAAIFEGTE